MAEDTQDVQATQEAPDAEQTPPEGVTDTPPEGGGEEPEADARVRRANKQAAEYRERAKKAEAELEKARQAGMSDQERQQAEFEQARNRVADLEQTSASLRMQLAAVKAGVDPSLVEFIDIGKVLARYDVDDPTDQGQIEKAFRKFMSEQPSTSRNVADAGATSTVRNSHKPSLNSFVRREAGFTS